MKKSQNPVNKTKKFKNHSLMIGLGMILAMSISSNGCQTTITVTPSSSPTPSRAIAVPVVEKSGDSIANARTLTKGNSTTFALPCTGARYVGPFNFTTDPESVKVHATAKSPSGAQICTGGSWVDSDGKFAGVVSIGCPEGTAAAEADLEFIYSPGNGGNAQKTVYLELKPSDATPVADCKETNITISFP